MADDLQAEPEVELGISDGSSSSDDSLIDEEPSEIPLDELEILVRGLDLASVTMSGYRKVSPLHFWLQGFGRGNPVHDFFRNMNLNKLHEYASHRKIHAALQILLSHSDKAERRQRAIVAVQKYHADDMIDKMLNALRDATPEEYTIYEPEDHEKASRRIRQWLKWQNRAVRIEGLPSGGSQSQELFKLDEMICDQLEKEDPSTFRHRYEVHASEPQSTPTHGNLMWGPGGSVTYPVQPLWYFFNKRGIPVRLPAVTRVWDPAEDCTKLTRRMPDYPMLYTPEEDGDGQFYRDQSRHRRGAVAVPKSTPPIPTFDRKLDTWWATHDHSAPQSLGGTLQSPSSALPPGIAAPSTYPESFPEEIMRITHVGPPDSPPRHWHVHDGWGLPTGGHNKRKFDQMAGECPKDSKRTKRGTTTLRRESPNVTHEADPTDPEWRHPSPKSGPCAPRPVAMSLADRKAAKVNALIKMHQWQWPRKSPENSWSQSSDDEDDQDDENDEDDKEDKDDENVEDNKDNGNDEQDGEDDIPHEQEEENSGTNSSAQPQENTYHRGKDSFRDPGNNPCESCQALAVLPHDSRPDEGVHTSKHPGNCQRPRPLLAQPRLPGCPRALGLRGLLDLFRSICRALLIWSLVAAVYSEPQTARPHQRQPRLGVGCLAAVRPLLLPPPLVLQFSAVVLPLHKPPLLQARPAAVFLAMEVSV